VALALIDAHHHFQDLRNHRYPWLDANAPEKLEGDLGPIRRDYLAADYARDLAGIELVASVHVQNGWDPTDPVGETRWLEAQADGTGRPDAIVAYADLAAHGVEDLLAAHAGHPRVRGIRQILNWHSDPRYRVAPKPDLMLDPGWRAGFARLAGHRLSFDLQLYWPQMDMARALARSFPDTQMVLDHFGMPVDRSIDGLAAWEAAMRRLAAAPNVAVKLSGFGLGHPAWTAEDTVPLLRRTLDLFGPDRTMVGTNLPVDRLFAPPARTFETIGAVVRELSDAERRMVLQGTAARVYRL
jgi:predicted TIM-barrel fold metal-dependent hydrolase